MSFDPLPDDLMIRLRDLCGRARCVALDLGCGDGAVGRLLQPYGLEPWGLDRVPPAGGTAAHLVADAAWPAVRPGRVDLLLAGNLIRHVVPREGRWAFLDRWTSLLAPGGLMVILEDEPTTGTPAENNYRRVQDLLVRITAGRRAPLLALAKAEPVLRAAGGDLIWRTGRQRNRLVPDVEAVLDLLEGPAGSTEGEVADLCRDIRTHGLSYGRFWYALGQRKELAA